MTMLKGFAPGFHETGKIKIGEAGEKRKAASGREYFVPRKLDHFIVTTVARGEDGKFKLDAVMAKLGEKPREIAVRLIFDSIEENFDTSYSFYQGSKCLCKGDGKAAMRRKYTKQENLIRLTGELEQVACPCELLDPSEDGKGARCKPYGILMCVLEKAEKIGGVYKFRTTSYHSIRSILTSLAFIRHAAGGILAGLPLYLTVQPKQVTTPSGQRSVVHIVNIEYRGSLDDLITKSAAIAKTRAQSQLSMKEVRKSLLLLTMKDAPEDERAVAEEFHTEAQEVEVIEVDPKTGEVIDGDPLAAAPWNKGAAPETQEAPAAPASRKGERVYEETGEVIEDGEPEPPAPAPMPAAAPARKARATPADALGF